MVRLTSSAAFATTSKATVTIGGVPADFEVTTAAESHVPDTAPDAFAFAPANNAAVNTQVTSNPATVSGLEVPASISIVGGEYSIDGGAFTSSPER